MSPFKKTIFFPIGENMHTTALHILKPYRVNVYQVNSWSMKLKPRMQKIFSVYPLHVSAVKYLK
jgi:hypothetical protein